MADEPDGRTSVVGTTRLAAYNVENMFDRPAVMDSDDWMRRAGVLAAHARVNELIQLAEYDADTRAEILEQLAVLGLVRSDASEFAILRKLRGSFLLRRRDGTTEVVADGRAAWVGFVELTTEPVTELSSTHTAMVMRDVGADVLGVVEAESRPVLEMFSSVLLRLSTGRRTTRSCSSTATTCAASTSVSWRGAATPSPTSAPMSTIATPTGWSSPATARSITCARRAESGSWCWSTTSSPRATARPATRLAGNAVGDLNDSPDSESLAPLLTGTSLRDVSEHPDFEWGPRRGTFGSGNQEAKIDYVLLSPALFAKATGGGVFRKGVYRGPRTRDPWEIYETLTDEVDEASDHAAIYADLDWSR